MNNKKNFFIFTCEKIFIEKNKFYCENIDIKTIIEGLQKNSPNIWAFKNAKIFINPEIGIK